MNETTILTEQTKLLQGIYYNQLLVIGVVCAVLVCFLLYKFLRKFF